MKLTISLVEFSPVHAPIFVPLPNIGQIPSHFTVFHARGHAVLSDILELLPLLTIPSILTHS